MCITKWKKPIWKVIYHMIPTTWHSRKGKTMKRVKRLVRWEGGKMNRIYRALRQWKYSIWCYHDEYISLHFYPKPTDWTSNMNHKSTDLAWFWCVNVDSSLAKKRSTILVSDNNGGGYACLGPVTKWEISEFLFQIYCKPKIF